jgi:hypothetical protein
MKRNRNQIPHELLAKKRRTIESLIFAFHDNETLVLYAHKKNRIVIALLTGHHNSKVGGE